jgi:hypothetical protein
VIPNHKEIKEKYMSKFEWDADSYGTYYRKKNLWNCNVTSSYFNETHSVPQFLDNNFYNEVVWKPFDNMLEKLGEKINLPTPSTSKITSLWYNKYIGGEWQEMHNHLPPQGDPQPQQYSGIYLLDLNEPNSTIFYENNPVSAFNTDGHAVNFKTDDFEEGSVIIFPSELEHYVNPCVNNRMTVSFNIFSKYGNVSRS